MDEAISQMFPEKQDPLEGFDCESIVSTYSTLENHPKVIDEPGRGRHARRPAAEPVAETSRDSDASQEEDTEAGQTGTTEKVTFVRYVRTGVGKSRTLRNSVSMAVSSQEPG